MSTTTQREDRRALARSSDPDTSHAAAAGVQVETVEARVLGALRLRPAGLTTHDLASALGLSLVTVSPRMRPLVKRGEVRDSGFRARLPGQPSRIIWQAVSARAANAEY